MKDLIAFAACYLRNLFSTNSLTDPASPAVVTLTSHSDRVLRVFATLESLGAGKLRPRRLIVFLGEKLRGQPLPASLLRAVARGVEIVYCEDVGPHTKYYPYVAMYDQFDSPLVTVDDDIMYGPRMLEDLVVAWRGAPDMIHCLRARRVQFQGNQLAPYRSWPFCRDDLPSFANFATGVSGVIYPPGFLRILKDAGTGFLHSCLKADDIWLHANAVRSGYMVKQARDRAAYFLEVPGSRQTALFKTNVRGDHNDKQIRAVYGDAELVLLKQAVHSHIA